MGWAAALIVVDAFVINQGVIAAVVAVWVLVISLPRAAFSKVPDQRRLRLARIGILLGAAAVVFALNGANNRLAEQRAQRLVAAVKGFHQKHQRYPSTLEELVPEFIDRVPRAKYTLGSGDFRYLSGPKTHALLYVKFPPFGRPTYNFEQGRWGYLD